MWASSAKFSLHVENIKFNTQAKECINTRTVIHTFFLILHTLLGNGWNCFRSKAMLSQWKRWKASSSSFLTCPRATCCLRATGWAGQDTRLWVGRSGVRITVGTRDICFLQNIQAASGAHPASYSMCKGKTIPLQAWKDPEGSRRLRLQDFKTIGTRRW